MENNRKLNRLQYETSPYLIQHAGNPVDWFPWGEEALKKGIIEDKLILVSIGYAACHWCHVMEHQSFEDESVAQLMNENFVCVKVDREERPDLDQVYMNAVQLITGSGGWPLNCFALPDGSPVYAGTYFPKDDWINVLKTLAGYWQTEKTKLVEHAVQIKTGMLGSDIIYTRANELSIEQSLLDEAVLSWKNSFDWEFGGDNKAPKFPMPNNYDFLLAYAGFKKDKNIDDFVKLTLNKISDGGINDHVGGGFARYSVDKFWKAPHFEKMLYDNAQLISLYSNAYKKFKSGIYKKIIEKTTHFVSQEMSSPEGGFYSSFDADSEGVEGKYYIWSYAELENILKDSIHIYKEYYSITEQGNWEQDNNILFISKDREDIAKANNLTPNELDKEIEKANKLIYTERKKRIAPLLDDKILTSWNALMITGFIDAYKALQVKDYLAKALRTAGFIVDNLMDSGGKLFRNYKNGVKSINAFLDDYSFTAKAFIKLFEVTGDLHWIQHAEQLVIYSIKHFYDENSGMFFYTSDLDAPLVVRKMEIADNVIPSSNSEMAKNLYLLSIFLNNEKYKTAANQMLANVKGDLVKYNRYYSNWALLALWFNNPFYEVIVVGEDAEKTTQQINSHYLPNCVVAYSVEESDFLLFKGRFVKGKTLIYVCQDNTCKMPVENVDEALKLIAG